MAAVLHKSDKGEKVLNGLSDKPQWPVDEISASRAGSVCKTRAIPGLQRKALPGVANARGKKHMGDCEALRHPVSLSGKASALRTCVAM
jgi:hypothetical protein